MSPLKRSGQDNTFRVEGDITLPLPLHLVFPFDTIQSDFPNLTLHPLWSLLTTTMKHGGSILAVPPHYGNNCFSLKLKKKILFVEQFFADISFTCSVEWSLRVRW